MILGPYKNDKPINITDVANINLKCECVNVIIVNGVREPILYSFGSDKPPGHKFYKTTGTKLFKKLNKSILSPITLYLEGDDHKPVDFNGEAITFTRQIFEN